MNKDELKKIAAKEAILQIDDGITLGIGSGSTVLCFIEELKNSGKKFQDIVCASQISADALKKAGFQVSDQNAVNPPDIYVDSCDEINSLKEMIKGGGAALTREKIIAAASQKFICIIDESKKVQTLGKFAVPIEVIPMARSYVGRKILELGGEPVWRRDCVTDNGNWIIDVHNWQIEQAEKLEQEIKMIVGVVEVGIFGAQKASLVITAKNDGSIEKW